MIGVAIRPARSPVIVSVDINEQSAAAWLNQGDRGLLCLSSVVARNKVSLSCNSRGHKLAQAGGFFRR